MASRSLTHSAVDVANLMPSEDVRLLVQDIRGIIPKLTVDAHKGQMGRIGVIGGSEEYTGAPYFSAISSVYVGADVAHVFCAAAAAPAIKSYSPELIVHPILDRADAIDLILPWLDRLHAIVVGPGLGRASSTFNTLKLLIPQLRRRHLPVVLDADALHFLAQPGGPDLISGYKNAILTPNEVEFQRIYELLFESSYAGKSTVQNVVQMALKLGRVTILRKGATDVITDGLQVRQVDLVGSLRRCGGQGDVLAGAVATFMHWVHAGSAPSAVDVDAGPPVVAAAEAASLLTRQCARLAFAVHGRGMTTSRIVEQIGPVFSAVYDPPPPPPPEVTKR